MYQSNARVQTSSCMFLFDASITADNDEAIADARGVEAVLVAMLVRAMKAHKSNEVVQENGCEALCVCMLDEEHVVVVAERGGGEVVKTALETHPSSSVVCENGREVLAKLQCFWES
ncbi:hypothetical protein T484DRAFT_1873374 [Baffinella frigidus]|nr:hypothetical protein T484DRAFT_1873374 [Cryptophyta sp. CCMP2293]